MQYRKFVTAIALGAMALGFSAGTALAQDTQSEQALKSGAASQKQAAPKMRQRMHRTRLKGRHVMSATVTSVDRKTGLTKLDSEGMHLTVHFPPPSLSDIKAGDKITVFLGFREGDVAPLRRQRMERREQRMKKAAPESGAH